MKLIPISNKAKKIFLEKMEGSPKVEALRFERGKYLLLSENRKLCIWHDPKDIRNWHFCL